MVLVSPEDGRLFQEANLRQERLAQSFQVTTKQK